MKKIALILIILSILAFPAFSDALWDTPGKFTIKGYKLNRIEEPNLIVVDALTGSLNEIDADDALVIDGYYTLGDSSSTIVDDIAFSYRVRSTKAGSFTVTLTVNPFVLETTESTKPVITTRYFLVNETVRFLDSNTDHTSDYVEDSNGLIIEDVTTGKTATAALSAVPDEDSPVQLVDKFSIRGSSNNSGDVWIARGALGFIIDSASYEKAPDGEYRANITITLSEDS